MVSRRIPLRVSSVLTAVGRQQGSTLEMYLLVTPIPHSDGKPRNGKMRHYYDSQTETVGRRRRRGPHLRPRARRGSPKLATRTRARTRIAIRGDDDASSTSHLHTRHTLLDVSVHHGPGAESSYSPFRESSYSRVTSLRLVSRDPAAARGREGHSVDIATYVALAPTAAYTPYP